MQSFDKEKECFFGGTPIFFGPSYFEAALGRQILELRQTWNNFEFEKFAVFDGLLNNIAKVKLKFKCWMNSNLQVYIFFLLCPVYLLWSMKNHLGGLSKVLLVKSSNGLFYGT